MHTARRTLKLLRSAPYRTAFITGVVLAGLSAKVLFGGSALNVLPWGMAACAIGQLASTPRQAWKLGAVLGFTISYCFLWFDKSDHTTWQQFIQLLCIIPLPSLFGGFCGSVLARAGYALRRK